MIRDLLINKKAKQKATIKAIEIAKVDFKGEYISDEYGVKIEILQIYEVDGVVEILAKAWKGNKQLGFGKDGSVEIERFLIYNPPILVDDPNGSIVIENTDEDGNILTRKLKEDPAQAMREVISHNAFLSGKENTEIKKGKVGNTTSTFFPAGGSVSPCDGYAGRTGVDETLSTIRAGAGNESVNTSGGNLPVLLHASTTTDQFQRVTRNIFGFDTSPLPDADTIDSATISLNPAFKQIQLGNVDMDLVSSSPASSSSLADSDYGNLGSTRFATGLNTSGMVIDTYEVFTLNASGLSNISKTGNSFFGVRTKWDLDNSFGGTWGSTDRTIINFTNVEESGTTKDPKLVVEHSSGTLFTEELTEVVTLVEIISKETSKTFVDVITLVDTVINKAGKLLSDTLVLVDSITTLFIQNQVLNETITLVESLNRSITISFIEVVTLVETFAKKTQLAFIETVTLVDSITSFLTATASLTETILVRDVLYGLLNGVNFRWIKKYVDNIGTYTKKYSDSAGTYIRKYINF